jgi:hypothetical protein
MTGNKRSSSQITNSDIWCLFYFFIYFLCGRLHNQNWGRRTGFPWSQRLDAALSGVFKLPDYRKPEDLSLIDWLIAVLRIRIRRIRMFLGHPDPLVRGMDPDPDPYIIKLK